MTQAFLAPVVRHIRRLAAADPAADASDAELLRRFVADREEKAFAALLRRHGPLVWGVCWQALHHREDAEDAFQATLLLLARQAGSIRRTEAVAGWLYRVAYRVARRAARNSARRRARERQGTRRPVSRPEAEAALRELQAVLQQELDCLPDKYRAPFLLCCLEGKTGPQAARQLGWKLGSVTGRLTEARKLLQRRLARRGVLLSAVLTAAAVSREGATTAAVALAAGTVRAALAFSAQAATSGSVSVRAAALAGGTATGLLAGRLKVATAVLLAVAVLAGGGLFAHLAVAAKDGAPAAGTSQADRPAPSTSPATSPRQAAGPTDLAGDSVQLSGQVIGPNGKPFAGAKLYVSTYTETDRPEPKVRATSGADGRFHFAATRSEVNRGDAVVAVADGCGPDWIELSDLDKDGRMPALHLVKDDVPVAGRVLDLEAHPIRGAALRVVRVRKMPGEDLTAWVKDLQADVRKTIFDLGKARKLIEYERTMKVVWGLQGVPQAVLTDAAGRFQLRGFGRERVVELDVGGPGIESRRVTVVTRAETPKGLPPFTYGARFDHMAAAGKPIVGTAREKGTGRPVKGVQVMCVAVSPGGSLYDLVMTPGTQATTDNQGRYRLPGVPKAKQYHLGAGGGPFFATSKVVNDAGGLEAVTADFDLERGIEVRGRLTDKAAGRPVRGKVYYAARPDNPQLKKYPGFASISVSQAVVDRDGSFTVAVVPGPGFLCARADEDRYVPAGVEEPGKKLPAFAAFLRFHAILPIDAAEKEPHAKPYTIPLDPGQTLRGTVRGPDGKPLAGAYAAGLTASYSPVDGSPAKARLPGADFTTVGLSRRHPRTLVFWHEEKNLGRALLVYGDEHGPLDVRLEPLAGVAGRLVDAAGRPQAGVKVQARYSGRQSRTLPGELSSEYALLIPPALRLPEATTDRAGRFQLRGLIRGLTYDVAAVKDGGRLGILVNDRPFPSGRTTDLGDVAAPAERPTPAPPQRR
jgi:RNA polymerase sigma factor (sigma-70 family)